MCIEASGWFFSYRGNWYGPYGSYEEVVDIYYRKNYKFPDAICYPIFA